jgi:hypothetical protein
LIGCGVEPSGFAEGTAPVDDDDDDAVGRDWIECPAGGCGLDVNVLERDGLPAPCADEGCTAEYLVFALAAAEYGEPVDPGVLHDQLFTLARSGDVPTPPELVGDELRAELLDATDVAFLFNGVDERILDIEQTDQVETDWGREEHLVVRDPWIGSMRMVLLRPNGSGPFPGLVAVPGHGDDWWDMRDAYLGEELADASWAMLIIDARASGADGYETEVTRTLLEAGLSFAGVRAYEQLLARKILRWRPDVHPDYVGVMGHSGGSVIANLSVRLDDFACLVSDLQSQYLNVQEDGPWLDETSAALNAWYPAINDLSTLEVPAYEDQYGYPAGSTPLRAFLRSDVLGL